MFEKNIAALREKNPDLAQRLEKIDINSITDVVVADAETKDLILGYKNYALHSTFDPVREAKALWNKTIRTELKKTDFVINFGLGLGYLFKRAYVESPCRIILLEPFTDLLRFVLEYVDFSAEFADERVYITDNIQDVLNKMQNEYLQGDSAEFLFLPAYGAIAQDMLVELTTRTLKILESKSCDANTIYKLAPIWTRNFIESLASLEDCVPLGFVNNSFEGKTALIIAPGPSLLKDIEKIKTNRDKFVIISAGKAVQVLSEYDIIPDFVTFADALGAELQIKDQEKLLEKTNLVVSLKTENVVFKLKSKSKILQLPETSTFVDLFKKYCTESNPGIHKSAGSVSIINYFVAKELGFKNIAFAGLDLAFPDNKIYATNEDLKTDENGKVLIKGIHTLDKQLVYTKDQNGKDIPTRDDYLVFIKQFEEILESEMSLTKVINTSMNGACIKGMDYMDFDKFLQGLDKQTIDVDGTLNKVDNASIKNWNTAVEKIKEEVYKNLDTVKQVKNSVEKLLPQVNSLVQESKTSQDVIQLQNSITLITEEFSSLRTQIMSNMILQNLLQGAMWDYVKKYKTGSGAIEVIQNNLELDYDLLETVHYLTNECINWINTLSPAVKSK